MRKISKREPVWTGCVERSPRMGTCTVLQFRVVIPTPPQANEVKMSVFATLEDPWLEIRLFEWDLLRLELSRMMAC